MTSAFAVGERPHWAATSCAVLFGIFFLTNWPVYHYSMLGGPIPLYYYVASAITLPILLTARPSAISSVVREPIFLWCGLYVASGLLWLTIAGGFTDEESGQWRLRMLAFLSLGTALALLPFSRRVTIVRLVLLCAALAAINNWLDFLFPFHFVEQGVEGSNPGRGAGLYVNANLAGTTIVAMAIAVIPFLAKPKRPWILLLMMIGVIPTVSRSAIGLAGLAILALVSLGLINRRQIAVTVLGVVGLIPIVFFLYVADAGDLYIDIFRERVEFFLSFGQILDESAVERRLVATIAWDKFSESPFFGYGLGASALSTVAGTVAGTHNMYLALLVEQGVVGGALYCILVLLIFGKGYRLFRERMNTAECRDIGAAILTMSAYVAVAGLFTHNLLERPSILFLLAILIAAASRGMHSPHRLKSRRGASLATQAAQMPSPK